MPCETPPESALVARALRNADAPRSNANQTGSPLLVSEGSASDPLTELPSHQRFVECVDAAIMQARQAGTVFAVLHIDIYRFSAVNNRHGHELGDAALLWIATQLAGITRCNDFLGRLGGDEFLMLVDNVRETSVALATAQRVIRLITQRIELGGIEQKLGINVGIAMSPAGASGRDLLRYAGIAVAHAKQRGGSERVSLFDRALKRRFDNENRVRDTLAQSLGSGDGQVVYQPIYDYRLGRVHSAEALFRWSKCDGLNTEEIITLAEATDCVQPIDRFALISSVAELSARDLPGLNQLSVNASVMSLDQGYRQLVTERLTRAGQLPFGLCVELTETAVSANFRETVEWVHRIRELNVAVALDDFGTGYASLKYVQQLEVDILKLDRELVSGVERDSSARSICEAAIKMAHNLGIRVVAEGVSNLDQFETLRALDCDYAQGYHIARPGSADALARSIAA